MSYISKPPFLIAEVGVNHNGSIKKAKKLIDFLSRNNVNAVKFQFFKSENLASKDLDQAPYQKNNKKDTSQMRMLKKYEFGINEHYHL